MKFVLVTGASGGMGKSAVNSLINNGYAVIALDKVALEKQENLFPVQVDLTNEQSVVNAFSVVKEITNELHAIVHFAGIYALDSLVEIDEESFVRIFNVNLFGAFRVNKTFLPLLKKGSRIVVTTSELAPLAPLPFTGLYAVTKSALDKYAYSLRMEVQLLDIYVSILRPGAVKTDMLGVSTRALDNFCDNSKLYSCNAKRFRRVVNRVEAHNVSPEKIAKVVLKAVKAKRPRFVYKINRNKLLLLLNALPQKLQTKIIKKILK